MEIESQSPESWRKSSKLFMSIFCTSWRNTQAENLSQSGISSKKLYQELGLESLRSRRWLRKLCLFYKIYKNKSPSYLYNLIPDRVKFYSNRSSQINNISNIKTKSSFKLDRDICNSDSLNVFKFSLFKIVRPVANSVFDINNPYELLTRLRLGLSLLRYHKFRHNFQDYYVPVVLK